MLFARVTRGISNAGIVISWLRFQVKILLAARPLSWWNLLEAKEGSMPYNSVVKRSCSSPFPRFAASNYLPLLLPLHLFPSSSPRSNSRPVSFSVIVINIDKTRISLRPSLRRKRWSFNKKSEVETFKWKAKFFAITVRIKLYRFWFSSSPEIRKKWFFVQDFFLFHASHCSSHP